ncbi:MFS transporter [Pararhizobium haloflavum]|uniref:MFS transporter n=1 Tax=Pararhizobium haloflavum TaxID=2037914 RepID=UPI000C1848B0|nr:MFS transporter [Pararhizobium haloflavum]
MSFFRFITENSRWLAGGFLLTFFSSFGQTFFISLSSGNIRAAYDLSHGEFGTLYMMATFMSALTLPVLGKAVDYIPVARVAAFNIPLLAVAAVGMALSQSLFFLFVTIYALRLFGQGMMTHNALTAIGRWYAAQRGRAMSVTVIGHQFGEATLPLVFVAVAAAIGWRGSWLLSAAFLVTVGLPVIYGLMRVERAPRATDGVERRSAGRDWTRGEVLRDPIFWLASLGVLAPGFIGTTIFFHQVYLVELRGWSLQLFAAFFVVMSSMTVLFSLISGALIDRFSAVRMLPVFLLPLGVACFILAFGEAQWTALAFMVFMGVSYGFSSTLMGALWPEIYGTRHLGAVRSVIVAILVFATSLGPGLTGFLIDFGVSYPAQIGAMGVYCFAVSGLMVHVAGTIRSRNVIDAGGGVGAHLT